MSFVTCSPWPRARSVETHVLPVFFRRIAALALHQIGQLYIGEQLVEALGETERGNG